MDYYGEIYKKLEKLGVDIDKEISFDFDGDKLLTGTVREYVENVAEIDKTTEDTPLMYLYQVVENIEDKKMVFDIVISTKLQQLEKILNDLDPNLKDDVKVVAEKLAEEARKNVQ